MSFNTSTVSFYYGRGHIVGVGVTDLGGAAPGTWLVLGFGQISWFGLGNRQSDYQNGDAMQRLWGGIISIKP